MEEEESPVAESVRWPYIHSALPTYIITQVQANAALACLQ